MEEKKLGIYVVKEHNVMYIDSFNKDFTICWEVYSHTPGYYETDEGVIRGVAGLIHTSSTYNHYDDLMVYFCGGSVVHENKVKSEIQKENSMDVLRYMDLNEIYEDIKKVPIESIGGRNTEESIILLREKLSSQGLEKYDKIDIHIITSPYHLPRTKSLIKKHIGDKYRDAISYYILINAHKYLEKFLCLLGKTDNIIYRALQEDKRKVNKQRIKYWLHNIIMFPKYMYEDIKSNF